MTSTYIRKENKINFLIHIFLTEEDCEVIKKCADVQISEADSTTPDSVDTDESDDVQVGVVESTTSDDGYCSTDQVYSLLFYVIKLRYSICKRYLKRNCLIKNDVCDLFSR